MSERIAIIGSGISGLASAWLLSKTHDVTLIEANDYVGGHTHTIEVAEGEHKIPVDTGFIVYNEPNYPLLTRLFERLGVATREGDMSFSASIGPGRIEYSGDSLNTLFAQRRNLLNPTFLRMLADMLRFNRRCKQLLDGSGFDGLSLGGLLCSGFRFGVLWFVEQGGQVGEHKGGRHGGNPDVIRRPVNRFSPG